MKIDDSDRSNTGTSVILSGRISGDVSHQDLSQLEDSLLDTYDAFVEAPYSAAPCTVGVVIQAKPGSLVDTDVVCKQIQREIQQFSDELNAEMKQKFGIEDGDDWHPLEVVICVDDGTGDSRVRRDKFQETLAERASEESRTVIAWELGNGLLDDLRGTPAYMAGLRGDYPSPRMQVLTGALAARYIATVRRHLDPAVPPDQKDPAQLEAAIQSVARAAGAMTMRDQASLVENLRNLRTHDDLENYFNGKTWIVTLPEIAASLTIDDFRRREKQVGAAL